MVPDSVLDFKTWRQYRIINPMWLQVSCVCVSGVSGAADLLAAADATALTPLLA